MQLCPNKNCKVNAGVMPFVAKVVEQVFDAPDGKVEITRIKCKHCNEVWTNVNLHDLTLSKSTVESQLAAIRPMYQFGTIKGVPPI